MAANDYHFVTVWRVPATIEEVGRIIADGASLTRWWPAVYLDVRELEPGDSSGLGKVIELHTKGWLPYTLRWRFRVRELREDGFTLDAHGDFEGRGIWTFRQDGPDAVITYDWRISAHKPLLRYLSPVLKPIFSANHHWAMAQGEQSLRLELARRRASNDAERARIPPPPAPTMNSTLPLAAALILLGAAIALVALRRRG